MTYDYETEHYGLVILDDGTMDTVVEVTDKATGETTTERYSPEYFDTTDEESEGDEPEMTYEEFRRYRLEMIADDPTLDQCFED